MKYKTIQQKLKEMRSLHGKTVVDVPLNAPKEKLVNCYLRIVYGKVIKANTLEDLNEKARADQFKQVQQKGLEDEAKVKDFMRSQGWTVTDSSQEENIKLDIDCWVLFPGCTKPVPVSIKAQHKGLEYNNVYWQLEEQLTSNGQWVQSGLYTTKAKAYAILQGSTLRFYITQDVKDYIETNGWLKVLSLSYKSKVYLGGGYYYQDARCGYLYPDDVRNVKFEL